jgi:hypothetical protein
MFRINTLTHIYKCWVCATRHHPWAATLLFPISSHATQNKEANWKKTTKKAALPLQKWVSSNVNRRREREKDGECKKKKSLCFGKSNSSTSIVPYLMCTSFLKWLQGELMSFCKFSHFSSILLHTFKASLSAHSPTV